MTSYEINELARDASRAMQEVIPAIRSLSEAASAATELMRTLNTYLEKTNESNS